MRGDHFWSLEHCSNDELLSQLEAIVGSGRRLTAELVAHLGEVEERRLHLEAAYSSMFDYCVKRLGLSEDEACRRIDVARLARRFPALYPRLASGEVSLTVAAVLKPHLTDENHERLLSAVSGKTVSRAREVIAALFPKPDVPSSVRKLPAPSTPVTTSALMPPMPAAKPMADMDPPRTEPPPSAEAPSLSLHAPLAPSAPTRVDPLSEARYRVQFTADGALKAKLDRARELLRHRNPSGDLGPIVERAVDLLLEQLMKERFGASSSPRQRKVTSERVTNATRRAVLERDGARCTWLDEHGQRCPAQGWLELDHRTPRGRGGGSGADNVRVLCRNHDRLAAERAYGRETIEQAIRQRRNPSAVTRE